MIKVKHASYLIFFLLWLSAGKISAQQSIKPFVEGDRVVFVGNSITCGGHYHSYIWLYYMTRFPTQRVEIINEGIGGDVAESIYMRLEDIFKRNPTVVTLTFGMNDVGYFDFTNPEMQEQAQRRIDESYRYFQTIKTAYNQHVDVRKIMIAGSPYDETSRFNRSFFPGKNDAMLEIVRFQEKAALDDRWGFVDFSRPMTQINLERQKIDSTFTLCGNDRIHPQCDGHMVMAYLFLKAQGFAGLPVAEIEIDASAKRIVKTENCLISALNVTPARIEFDYLPNALPYPLDTTPREGGNKSQADAIQVIPFMDEMNRETLCVKGLEKGRYKLIIDGMEVSDFYAEDFEKGVNMATLKNTPQYRKALTVMRLNEERWLMERQMREYYWVEYNVMRPNGLLYACNEAAVDTLRVNITRNIFVRGNAQWYFRYMHNVMREESFRDQKRLIDRIYSINSPDNMKIIIEKII